MNTKVLLLLSVLTVLTVSLQAQITKPEADSIVIAHLDSEQLLQYTLYFNINSPSENDIEIMTTQNESVKIKYVCYAYFLKETENVTEPSRCRYLFVKQDNGNLLEIITNNDLGPEDFELWKRLGMVELQESKLLLYPNPVSDVLIIPYTGSRSLVEVYDLQGKLILSEKPSEYLDVSLLVAGVYMLKIYFETGIVNYKIIKN
jgi:hypothetical protein